MVHEHKINRDMIAYWYEKLTYSSSGYKMNEYLARYVWKEVRRRYRGNEGILGEEEG